MPKKGNTFQSDSRGKWMLNYEGPYTMTFATTDGDKLTRPIKDGAVKK